MAESVVKLRVDNKDYDANIKSARQGLLAMEQACRKVGGTLEVVEKDELNFVKAMGEMETTSKTAKGQLREMTEAINDLSLMYKRLTDEEKKSPFGKAMVQSMEKLKVRAADIQDQMADLNEELKHLSSDTGFTDGMRNMTGVIGSCASAVVAFTGDSKELDVVIKDLAKIQTTVAAVEALTKAFQKQNLVMLKNPYVIAATAAAAAGVAIYEFASKQNEAAEKVKMSDDAIKNQAQSLIALAQAANTASSALSNLTKSQAKAQYDNAIGDLSGIQSAMSNQKALIDATESALNEAMSKAMFGSRDEAIANRDTRARLKQQLADQKEVYRQMQEEAKKADSAVALANARMARAKDDPVKEKKTRTSQEKTRLQEIQAEIQKLEQAYIKADDAEKASIKDKIYWLDLEKEGLQSIINQTHSQESKFTIAVRPTISDEDAKRWSDEITAALNDPNIKAKADVNTIFSGKTSIADQYKDGDTKTLDEVAAQWDQLQAKIQEMQSSGLISQSVIDDAKSKLAELGEEVKKLGQEYQNSLSMKNVATATQAVSSALSSASSAMGQFASESEEAAAAQKAFTIAAAVAQLVGQFAAIPKGVEIWSWIAGTIAGVATLTSAVATMKSFADGGMITGGPGTDGTLIRAHAGELVLNQAMQENVAAGLEANGGGGYSGTPYVSGEMIALGVSNWGKRSGRGELVFSRDR